MHGLETIVSLNQQAVARESSRIEFGVTPKEWELFKRVMSKLTWGAPDATASWRELVAEVERRVGIFKQKE